MIDQAASLPGMDHAKSVGAFVLSGGAASSLSTGSCSLQARALSLQYPQLVYIRILTAPAATVEAAAERSGSILPVPTRMKVR